MSQLPTPECISKDIAAKVSDLNEAIELAAKAGVVVWMSTKMQLFTYDGLVHDVPSIEVTCLRPV